MGNLREGPKDMRAVVSRFVVAMAGVTWLCFVLASSASADIGFCTFGSGAGQCKAPAGVAADRTSGNVYIADPGNGRINIFSESGVFISSFGSPGSGLGQFTTPRRVAVDNNATSPNFHDVFVADSNLHVQRFSPTGVFEQAIGVGQLSRGNSPIAVGPNGNLYIFDSTGTGSEVRQVKIFDPAGVQVGSSTIGEVLIDDAVVDSGGDAYINRIGIGAAVEKYELNEPTATLLLSVDAGANTKALALDGADNFYASQRDEELRQIITKRSPAGTIIKRFGYGEIQFNLQGLAVGASGALFGSEEYVGAPSPGNRVIRIPQPGPGPLPCCLAPVVGNTKATIVGQVNPEGAATTYHFEYITEADYNDNGNSFEGANPAVKTPESGVVGSDFNLYEAKAEIGCASPSDPPQLECLKPATVYRVRLVATNADGVNEAEGSFKTRPPFEIKDTFATDVGITTAKVGAKVNPQGIAATAYFEYVDDAAFAASGFATASKAPAAPIDLGAGSADVSASAQLSGLQPGTVYHYRVVVADSFVPEGEPGPELTFLTYPSPTAAAPCANDLFRVALSAPLPNCRAYEMVSPVDKNGGDIKVTLNPTNFPARLDQSADDGESFTYSAVPAFSDPLSAPYVSQYLARRGAGGWSNEAINPPRESVPLTEQIALRLDAQYKLFSPDLSNGWLGQDANPALGECAPEGFINLYRHNIASGDYEALIPNAPPASDPLENYRLELQGVSADGTRTVFRASTKLTSEAANTKGQNAYQLYMHEAGEGCGKLRLVSFRPNGTPSPQSASAGSPRGPGEYRESNVARAISEDGRRAFFTLSSSPIENGTLYARINADQPQSAISGGKCTEAGKGCTLEISATTAQYWSAATDGSVALYSVGDELLEYDVDKAIAGEAAKTTIAADSEGVVAVSEDAAKIFFVSEEEIDGEGKAGEPNLYLYQREQAGPERYRLVGTLAGSDLAGQRSWGTAVATPDPIRNGVRLTADGSQLAFVSAAPLTGYDNRDARDGKPNLELFHYDTASGDLKCVSCNPSGARPQGREFEEGAAKKRVAAMMAPQENTMFSPRALSADGNRLFFESFESLLPRDVNKKQDVYEWERAGSQEECRAKGAELFVPASGGCLSMISSGLDEVDSELADASPDGSDVFIRTSSSLLPQDAGQVDVYDAREGGGFPLIVRGTPCEGEACPTPPGPTPALPPIATQNPSTGNVKPPCPKGKVLRKGKCVRKPCPKGKVRKGNKCKPKKAATKNKKANKNKKGARR